MPSYKKLDKIGDEGIRAIGEGLKNNKTLQTLYVGTISFIIRNHRV